MIETIETYLSLTACDSITNLHYPSLLDSELSDLNCSFSPANSLTPVVIGNRIRIFDFVTQAESRRNMLM